MQQKASKVSRKCCAYCGYLGKLTVDHIPPRCLFRTPAPNNINLITVPACKHCNTTVSLDDEYFRTVLALRHDTYAHPDVQNTLPSVMRSFASADKIQFARWFFSQMTAIDVKTPAGIYLGKREGFNVDLNRVNSVTSRITTGLFYREFRTRVPDDYCAVSMSADEYDRQPNDVKKMIGGLLSVVSSGKKRTVGEDVFSYQFLAASDQPLCSIWFMTFYGKLTCMTLTLPRKNAKLLPQPSPLIGRTIVGFG